MNETISPDLKRFFVDKKRIQQIVAETNAKTGFIKDQTATPEKAQAMTIALGIRPEDNLLSCGINAARDEE